MLKKVHCLALVFWVVATSMSWSQESNKVSLGKVFVEGLSVYQAEQILRLVLRHEGFKLDMPRMSIERGLADEKGRRFIQEHFDFHLYYSNPNAGALSNLGFFIVNQKNGDVWEFHSCKRFVFPALQRLQEDIVKQTGVLLIEEKVQRKRLGCADED
ncbi:MAG: hypothetical protein FWH56_09655 [Betaproteobacteria bacterium]|nr:hypothetical protein [Betaproteobacteria bacterium]